MRDAEPDRITSYMDEPLSSMRDLAQRLLALSETVSGPRVHQALVLGERLRTALVEFTGTDGFASLLRRALTLASADVTSLQSARVGTDGRLEGLEQHVTVSVAAESEAAIAITAHLLDLLVTFIGEPLTLKLVRKAWPDTTLEESPERNEADR